MNVESVVAIVVLILPGYLALAVKDFMLSTKKTDRFDKILYSLPFSCAIYLAATLCTVNVSYVVETAEKGILQCFSDREWLTAYFLLLGLAIILGLAWGLLRRTRLAAAMLYRLTRKSHFCRVWDEFHAYNNRRWVRVVLKGSQEEFIGLMNIISDSPGERDIVLHRVHSCYQGAIGEELNVEQLYVAGDSILLIQSLPTEYQEKATWHGNVWKKICRATS